MWSAPIVMSHPLFKDSPPVSLIERDKEIQTLAPHASHQAFAESIRLGRSEGRFQNAQAHRLQGRVELGRVNAAAVVDEEPVGFLPRPDFAELLKRPARRGMSCDIEVGDLRVPTSMTTKTYSTRKLAVTVTKKSQARMPWAWLRTNVIQD